MEPAVGQRWKDTEDGEEFTLTGRDGFGEWLDSNGGGYWPLRCFTNGRLVYLGTSQTQPAPPFNCAACGFAGYGTECPACAPPQKSTPGGWYVAARATVPVEAPTPPLEVPAKHLTTLLCLVQGCETCAIESPREKNLGAEPRDELARPAPVVTQSSHCESCALLRQEIKTLLTELAALRQPYTRKKKPEPWVPSCDIDADIPDA